MSTRNLSILIAASIAAVAVAVPTRARAGDIDPLTWQVPADEGSCVRLCTGGPRGCGMVPSNIPPGQQAQVWHVPWQEGGLIGVRPGLWPINNHGTDVPRPPGAWPMTVMDHTILIVYGPDGRTPVLIGEFLPEAEGNWQTHRPGSQKFNEYMAQMNRGTLIPGPRGTTNGNPVGATYGLGDHCCTNTANAQINNPVGPGRPARGLNMLGYQLNRCGVTPFIRDNLGRCRDTYNYCNYRFGPGINTIGRCAPDVVNDGLTMGGAGWNLGSNGVGMFTDDPWMRDAGGVAGAGWFGTIGVEGAVYRNTGQLLLPARYSPTYWTGRGLQTTGQFGMRCASGGGRLLVQGGRAAATNPLTIVVAGGVYLNYEANNYRCAVNDLCAMDDLSGVSQDEFDAMIPYNVISGAYWQNVGAFYGLCDPLPPPRTTFRGRPAQCGAGNVRANNVDPPFEDDADLGCALTGASRGAGWLVLVGLGALIARRRRARSRG